MEGVAEQIPKDILNPKKISKEKDQAGRETTAAVVVGIRKEKRELESQASNLNEETQELEKQKKSWWYKLTGILKSTATKQAEEEKLDDLKIQAEALQVKASLIKPGEILKEYYEKAANIQLTVEEKKKYLTPEFMVSLTTDEYIALWRRLNPYYLAHVTRQGIRDHAETEFHKNGFGAFINGFKDNIAGSKRIESPYSAMGIKLRDKDSTLKYIKSLSLKEYGNKTFEEAFETVRRFLLKDKLGFAPTIPDKTAVHLTSEVVADNYYGGEDYNEIFYIFPSDYIASQHTFDFHGRNLDFRTYQNELIWNDIFVWNKDPDQGIPLDSGLVFLPDTIQVDPKTGSKYATETVEIDGKAVLVPVVNTDLVERFAEQNEALLEDEDVVRTYRLWLDCNDQGFVDSYRLGFNRTVVRKLQGIGFGHNEALRLIDFVFKELRYKKQSVEDVKDYVKKNSLAFKGAVDKVTAREYWEGYFSEHPDQKPKHIVWYDGSPTTAVDKFLDVNQITRPTDNTDPLLGFADKNVSMRIPDNFVETKTRLEEVIKEAVASIYL